MFLFRRKTIELICISILHWGFTFTLNWISIKRINQMSAVSEFIVQSKNTRDFSREMN